MRVGRVDRGPLGAISPSAPWDAHSWALPGPARDSLCPAALSADPRLCPPRHWELPSPRVGTGATSTQLCRPPAVPCPSADEGSRIFRHASVHHAPTPGPGPRGPGTPGLVVPLAPSADGRAVSDTPAFTTPLPLGHGTPRTGPAPAPREAAPSESPHLGSPHNLGLGLPLPSSSTASPRSEMRTLPGNKTQLKVTCSPAHEQRPWSSWSPQEPGQPLHAHTRIPGAHGV